MFSSHKITQRRSYTQKPLHREGFAPSSSLTNLFAHRRFSMQELSPTEAFAQTIFQQSSFYPYRSKENLFTDMRFRKGTFSTNGFYIQQLTHREAFARTNSSLFCRAAFMRSNFHVERPWHRRNCIYFRAIRIYFGVWILVWRHGFRYCMLYFIYNASFLLY